jgi:hypothetical protein
MKYHLTGRKYQWKRREEVWIVFEATGQAR